jgi:hypothetical protein
MMMAKLKPSTSPLLEEAPAPACAVVAVRALAEVKEEELEEETLANPLLATRIAEDRPSRRNHSGTSPLMKI